MHDIAINTEAMDCNYAYTCLCNYESKGKIIVLYVCSYTYINSLNLIWVAI